jgi:hypothetical protein
MFLAAGALLGCGFFAGKLQADQPHMQAALSALQTARTELQQAATDKGGHRKKALDYVNSAIIEVQAGISYDRKH